MYGLIYIFLPMALSIKDPEADRLARALARATGESLTVAIRRALEERLEREQRRTSGRLKAEVRRIQDRLASLPVIDDRSAEEILDYDERGVPR